jgi:hypothetical protein
MPVTQLQALFQQVTNGGRMHPLQLCPIDDKDTCIVITHNFSLFSLFNEYLFVAEDVQSLVRDVINLSASEQYMLKRPSVVLICGTGYILADARATIGITEPR